jgi:hypothetical protein
MKTVRRGLGMTNTRRIDTIAPLWQIWIMRSKKTGLFSNMPYSRRVIVLLAALLFMTGQIVGAMLNRFAYAWLWWL